MVTALSILAASYCRLAAARAEGRIGSRRKKLDPGRLLSSRPAPAQSAGSRITSMRLCSSTISASAGVVMMMTKLRVTVPSGIVDRPRGPPLWQAEYAGMVDPVARRGFICLSLTAGGMGRAILPCARTALGLKRPHLIE